MKQKEYVAPSLEVFEIKVEKGYAGTTGEGASGEKEELGW